MRKLRGMQVLGLGALMAIQVAACANVNPNAARDKVWSERLTAQAQAIQHAKAQQDRSNAVWAQRLNAMAIAYERERTRQQRADAAYSQRMTKLAAYVRGGGHAY